jgi:hypothetical protein
MAAKSGTSIRMLARRWIILLAAIAAAGLLLFLFLRKSVKEGITARPPVVAGLETSRERADLEVPAEAASGPRSLPEPLDLPPPAARETEADPAEQLGEQPAARAKIRGQVVDALGEPISHLNVRWKGERTSPSPLAASDATGRFSFESDRTYGTLIAEGDGFVPLMASLIESHTLASEHFLVSAAGRTIRGVVTDPSGSGLKASVSTRSPLVWPFSEPLDAAIRNDALSSRTASDGRFALERVPDVDGVEISASCDGYAPTQVAAPRGDIELTIVLQPIQQAKPLAITGVVLLPDRSPAAGARVAFAQEATVTDEQGGFHLPLEWSRPEMILAAGLKGYGSAVLPRFGEIVAAASPQAPPPATLVLGPKPLSIAGVVVDERGAPLTGWIVSVVDATEVSQSMVPILYAEGLGGGDLESKTDKDGAFRIRGLLDRDYVLRALDPRTLLAFETKPLPAGEEHVRIQVPGDLAFPAVAGTVLSRKGAPIAGARVQLGLVTQQSGGARQFETRDEVLSDERGAFEFLKVPRRGAFLRVRGEAVIPAYLDLSPDLDVTAIAIEVATRCDFRIHVTEGERLYAEVLDGAGAPLTIHSFTATGSSSSSTLSFRKGEMAVWSVSDDARTLRVLEGLEEKREIHRQPISLVPGVVTEIRLDL